MINVLFAARPDLWDTYEPVLKSALDGEGLNYILGTDLAPDTVDYIVYAPNGPVSDFSPFTRLKAVLSLWAGVETIVGNPTLKVPLARMVDHGLTQGMIEWVTGHVLRHHLGMDAHIHGLNGEWKPVAPPLAEDRKVTILGLGALGGACGQMLARLGFDVHGWSRRTKSVDGITCHAGDTGLRDALNDTEIVVLLLPDTPATHDILNTESLGWMAQGAVVINPGRGPLIDDDALLAALDSGRIGHATLDVFRVEPLPVEHPYWHHPRVTVTPHIASETRPRTASEAIAANIRRNEDGEGLRHTVDPAAGY